MQKKNVVKRMKEVEEPESVEITCNKCGKTKTAVIIAEKYDFVRDEFHEFLATFGYGSSFDLEYWSFDLCENCLVDIVKTFKYVPKGFRIDQQYPLVKDESKEHQALFDDWKNGKEWDEFRYKSDDELNNLRNLFDDGYIDEVIAKRKEEGENN
ncbi:hypothetical protein [Virgibacillus proomii]|uniref:hypothetical protein n=1 Tax=Virgibacillus proomii TaxID=84407 RepID=UPI001C105C20|nr:hypothetical protein [Virgibacillus proomii]MBU5266259.1 hypothetical protein [Virgibacillus proomii]